MGRVLSKLAQFSFFLKPKQFSFFIGQVVLNFFQRGKFFVSGPGMLERSEK
jgi:hypothetical protein